MEILFSRSVLDPLNLVCPVLGHITVDNEKSESTLFSQIFKDKESKVHSFVSSFLTITTKICPFCKRQTSLVPLDINKMSIFLAMKP